MFECPGLSPGDARRLRVCERTNLLLVEFNAVSCSSRSTMEAGPWTGQGYSAPWMYHSVAGQYTVLEKRLVSDWPCPCRRRPGPRVLQDATNNWHEAPPAGRWGPSRSEGHWFPGQELGRTASPPKARGPCSPAGDGPRPVRRRDLSWGAAPAAKEGFGELARRAAAAAASCRWPQGAPGRSKAEALARAPPSYEDHLLLRLRAGEGPRKENWPRPPPYVAPPAYEGPHRTVQPQQRVRRGDTSTASQQCPLRAGGYQAAPGRKAGRCPPQLPRGWGYLSGATTWAGARAQPERTEWCRRAVPAARDRSPQRGSHTLPRVSKRSQGVPCHVLPGGAPQHALPAGWGFSHAAGWPGALGHRGKQGRGNAVPRSRGPSPARARGGSSPAGTPQRPAGGLFVIDATCVVIQAHYIPAPRTERVRYLRQERGADKVRAATAPCSPARASMEERAVRILGLPLGDLGLAQTGGKAPSPPEIPGHRLRESCATSVAVPAGSCGAGQPGGLTSPQHSPRKPPLAPTAPSSFQEGPTVPELGSCPDGIGVPCQRCEGCPPQAKEEPLASPPGRSYVRDLKEAMLRIRRHTAPDSDTDEELEKEGEPTWGQSKAWSGHLNEGTKLYSSNSNSSSSLESCGSNTTVVPGNAAPTLRKGPQSNSQLMLYTGVKVGQAMP